MKRIDVKRWILRGVALCVLGVVSYGVYDYHFGPYSNMPDLPDGAYAVAFENGFRGIVLDADVENSSKDQAPVYTRLLSAANPARKYLSVPMDVQPWFADAWSRCTAPSAEEQADLERRFSDDLRRSLENARFEAVCRLDVDGSDLVRGFIFSVPNL